LLFNKCVLSIPVFTCPSRSVLGDELVSIVGGRKAAV